MIHKDKIIGYDPSVTLVREGDLPSDPSTLEARSEIDPSNLEVSPCQLSLILDRNCVTIVMK